jgi:hypothetical protein
MELAGAFASISGESDDSCVGVLLRWEAERGHFKPAWGDSFLVAGNPDRWRIFFHSDGWMTGAWRSPGHLGFFSHSRGDVFRFTDLRQKPSFVIDEMPFAAMGIWGLDDEFVLVWGDRDRSSGGMQRWDGSRWNEMESPGFGVIALHGVARDLIVAVGEGGLISRWDGKHWQRLQSPTESTWTSVWVVDEETIYVSGNPTWVLRGGTRRAFEPFVEGPGRLPSVAVWRGQLWVAAGAEGLWKLEGDRLALVRKVHKDGSPFSPERLDARQQLLVGLPSIIACSEDGEKFTGLTVEDALGDVENDRPKWLGKDA